MSRPLRLMISAGEASGDRLGAGLARALRRRHPEVELLGMGGPRMAEAGVRLVQSSGEVAVVGIAEVLSHLPAIRRAMGRLEDCLTRERPDLLIPIDFPDFNLRLASRAKRAGVDVVYFVSPQVWAWRRRRVQRIRGLVRRMLVLFPFEVPFYETAGVPVTFVGHPAMEREATSATREELCRRAGLDPLRDVVALVPGSRRLEVERLLPPMLGAARRLRHEQPGLQFLVPRAPEIDAGALAEAVREARLEDVRIHDEDFPAVLSACRAGVVASGTASLEAALEELPMVVVYRMSPVTHFVARALVRLDHVALPNLVAQQRVVPELIQGDCTPQRIAEELTRLLRDGEVAERVRAGLREVRRRLGEPGVFGRAADVVLAELAAKLDLGGSPVC